MSESSYDMTGFQSACAEFAESPLSLDERYLTNKPATFIIEVEGHDKDLEVKKGDKLVVDRSLSPRENDLVLLVINNEFTLKRFSKRMLEGQDPETGNFLWGVVKTQIREHR